MKKILLTTTLLSTFVLGGALSASADVVKTADTPIGIEFEPDGGTELVPGPYKGVLTLVYKPTAFEFGKTKATGALLTFNAQAPTGENKDQWLVVNDDRDNTTKPDGSNDDNAKRGDAWQLTAKMAPLTSGAETLPASLLMKMGAVKKYDMGTTPDGNDIKPNPADDTNIVAFPEDAAHGVTLVATDVELVADAGAETKIMSKALANGNKVGVATQVTDTKLRVQAPTTAAGKSYTSKVTWTLSTGIE